MNDETQETLASQSRSGDDSNAHNSNVARETYDMSDLPDMRDHRDETDSQINHSREEFTTVFDMIDEMEAKLDEAKGTVFTPGVVKINRDEFMSMLDDLKSRLPVQLERASALMREAERRLSGAQSQAAAVVANAQSRAAGIIEDANTQAQFLAGQQNVTELARQKAREILDTAQQKADKLTQGADNYSLTMMQELQHQLEKCSRDVSNGIDVLTERQREESEHMPHLTSEDYPDD